MYFGESSLLCLDVKHTYFLNIEKPILSCWLYLMKYRNRRDYVFSLEWSTNFWKVEASFFHCLYSTQTGKCLWEHGIPNSACAPWSLMEKSQEVSATGDFHSVRICVILFSLVELSLQLIPILFLIDIWGIYQIVTIDEIN